MTYAYEPYATCKACGTSIDIESMGEEWQHDITGYDDYLCEHCLSISMLSMGDDDGSGYDYLNAD